MSPQQGYTTAPQKSRSLLPLVVVLVVLLLAAAGVATWAIMRNTAHEPAQPASAAPKMLSAHGSVLLAGNSSVLNIDDYHCRGMLAYDDVHPGTVITIKDGSGTVIGTGQLSQGLLVSKDTRTCSFTFEAAVPVGKGSYAIAVGQYGAVNFAEADLRGSVQVKLGE